MQIAEQIENKCATTWVSFPYGGKNGSRNRLQKIYCKFQLSKTKKEKSPEDKDSSKK